jgi:sugar phosphate isomerase/epimerase
MLPHLLFGHTSDMLYLLGEIRECSVGACLDTGHANLAGELSTVIHKLSGHLKMLHINDNRGDRDAHLPPGEGVVDWPWIIAELKRCQFGGTLILELSSREDEPPGDILGRAQHARDYLRSLARQTG